MGTSAARSRTEAEKRALASPMLTSVKARSPGLRSKLSQAKPPVAKPVASAHATSRKASNPIRTLVAEDSPIYRLALRHFLDSQSDIQVVADVALDTQIISIAKRTLAKLALLGVGCTSMENLETIRRFVSAMKETSVLAICHSGRQENACKVLEAGVQGIVYSNASFEDLLIGLRKVYSGERLIPPDLKDYLAERFFSGSGVLNPVDRLTPREVQVLIALSQGFTRCEIADKLFLSPRTIDTYRTRLLAKLELRNLADLTRFCIDHKLLDM